MHLRLMSYNIHRAIGVDRRFRLDRIESIITHHAPDVLLLQEVDQGAPRSQRLDLAQELASRLNFAHHAVGHNVTLREGRYGNATLSRFPIREALNIDLTIGRFRRRGCQYTEVELPALGPDGQQTTTPLAIFNLHLGLLAQERARQVGLLARSATFKDALSTMPCVVGGDFNDWRLLLHPVFVDVLGFLCATQRRASYASNLRTYPSFSPSGSLDRFYYRGLALTNAKTCRLAASRVASDHLPVIADFVERPIA